MKKRTEEARIPRNPGARCASCVYVAPKEGYKYLLNCTKSAQDHGRAEWCVFQDDWCSAFKSKEPA